MEEGGIEALPSHVTSSLSLVLTLIKLHLSPPSHLPPLPIYLLWVFYVPPFRDRASSDQLSEVSR